MNMNPHIKDIIRRDYIRSGKDLGSFALDWMKTYDDISYELVIVDAQSKNGKVQGTAVMNDLKKMNALIEEFKITGDYYIRTVDTQKEFFLLLSEIRDDLKRAT